MKELLLDYNVNIYYDNIIIQYNKRKIHLDYLNKYQNFKKIVYCKK